MCFGKLLNVMNFEISVEKSLITKYTVCVKIPLTGFEDLKWRPKD